MTHYIHGKSCTAITEVGGFKFRLSSSNFSQRGHDIKMASYYSHALEV